MSTFQLIVIGVFVLLIVAAVLLLGGFIPGLGSRGGEVEKSPVVIWGTLPASAVVSPAAALSNDKQRPYNITYVEKRAETFERELLDALAAGAGPDAWLVSPATLFANADRLAAFPFTSWSERDFRDTFADAADIFLRKNSAHEGEKGEEGIMAFPLVLDPIILYYNRDLLSSAGLPAPPATWDEFVTAVEKLTVRDDRGNVATAGAALGEARNVKNFVEILSLLMLQTGNAIVDPLSRTVLMEEQPQGGGPGAAEQALRFYIEFSNPSKPSYTWNRALPLSAEAFAAGKLAFYFGYVSEYNALRAKNPHLSIDAALVPQVKGGNLRRTYGQVYGFGVSKISKHRPAALAAVADLAGKERVKSIAEAVKLPPARRDLLAVGAADPVLAIGYNSAIMARAWLEPSREKVTTVFSAMVEAAATGRARVGEATSATARELEAAFRKR